MRPAGVITPQARPLLPLVLPAVGVGVLSSLVLLVVSAVAERLFRLVWNTLPAALGVAGGSPWWTIGVLTAAGALAGLVLWKVPSGPDPATESLVGPPLPVRVLPGVTLGAVVTLAGGISLGPENPITAINVALAFALGPRLVPGVPGAAFSGFAAAGTIGALFGTPVAAALILSESAAGPAGRPLWDRLFGPLIAAGAGATTTVAVANPSLAIPLPAYTAPTPMDAAGAAVVATVACALGLVVVTLFPAAYKLFRLVPHPVARLAAAGLLLGVLGAIGGRITLFKGLDQMKELVAGHHTAAGLLLILVVKLVAVLVAASAAFVGGRIFPVVFAGVALGLLVHALLPAVPAAVAVSSAVLGLVLAVTQQGWLSLFTAAVVVTDPALIPVLCLAVLPAWLLVSGRPAMVVQESPPPPAKGGSSRPDGGTGDEGGRP
ncbi:ion channel protein [Sinosporangium siamense]|uniref:ion channel protein n=1 Tax=Sinosporangium siamense TaxID=1367973 RepID=UPI001EF340C1|nr:ion channel protein [Sinosporangium siamense]